MSIPKQSSVWDQRRNTSMVIPPPLGAHRAALAALAAFRRSDPATAKWIEDGHPLLTHDEHVARFGTPYKSRPRRVT